jgi:elongation factor G
MVKVFETNEIINTCLIGNSGVGKTSFAEALLYTAGVTSRLGRIDDGNTVSDYTQEEIERRGSIYLASMFLLHAGKKINIIDVPGYADFFSDSFAGIWCAENLILVFDATSSELEADAEDLLFAPSAKGKPVFIFINKMDKENANFARSIEVLQKSLSQQTPVVMTLPIGVGERFSGVADVLTKKYYGKNNSEMPLTPEVENELNTYYNKLVEAVAAEDEALIEKYLNGEEITQNELISTLIKSIQNAKIVPLFCGSCINNIGTMVFLEFFSKTALTAEHGKYTTANDEIIEVSSKTDGNKVVAHVFKTVLEPHMGRVSYFKVIKGKLHAGMNVINYTRNIEERIGQICLLQGKEKIDTTELPAGDIGCIIKLKDTHTNDTLCDEESKILIKKIEFPPSLLTMAIYSSGKGEEEKLATALSTASEEDPTISFTYNTDTKEWIVTALGERQLEIMAKKFSTRFGVKVELRTPKVPYRETITTVSEQQGKYKRQTGGRGQYGDCWLRVEPLPREIEYEFVNKITQGKIPKNYIPSIEKGVKEVMESGVIAGYRVVNIRVILYDGSYHEVDSSDIAFKIAGRIALRKCVETANPIILEPYANVDIDVTKEYVGAVIGDLNMRRGRVLGIEPKNGKQVIHAQLPYGEVYRYITDLRSMTKGKGKFKMSFSHYEPLNPLLQQKLIEEYQKSKQEEKEE